MSGEEQTKNVPFRAVESVSDAELGYLRAATAKHWDLKSVLDWCMAQQPPIIGADVVAQDEFTHDFLVPLPSGTWLAYDTT